ncbi:unnamed protein product [Rotaria sordida]|uniref:PAZ domain-containing protein n=1 Tax=Rotaria sordida TaxID=392033 RepID=A0A814EKA5_9BILA|nr:unnamed protein product [Rotaria sordida]
MIRRDGQLSLARKDERWQILQELAKNEKNFSLVCRRQQLIDLIETTHAGRPLRYRVKGFGKSANQLTFNLRSDKDQTTTTTTTSMKSENELTFDDSNGYQSTIELKKSVSVAEYFTKKYKRLQYPNLPCVDARNENGEKTNWLPMEVVKIVEWESSLRPLDSVQRALVSKTTIVKPDR